MPVEIKELVIRAVISDEKSIKEVSESVTINENAVIKECVQQVLKILKRQKRR